MADITLVVTDDGKTRERNKALELRITKVPSWQGDFAAVHSGNVNQGSINWLNAAPHLHIEKSM